MCDVSWAAEPRWDAWSLVAISTWRRAAQRWGLVPDGQHSAEWWCKPTAVLRSWPDLCGSSLKHVSKTHGITKRSRPEATPVALEPWHYKGKLVSKPHSTWIACGLNLSHCTSMHAHELLFSLLLSLFCFPLQESGADPGRKVQRGASRQSLIPGGLGEPEGRVVAHSLGRSVHRAFLWTWERLGKLAASPAVPTLVYAVWSWVSKHGWRQDS